MGTCFRVILLYFLSGHDVLIGGGRSSGKFTCSPHVCAVQVCDRYQFYILQGKISAKEQKSSASLHHCLASDEVEANKAMCNKSFKIKAYLWHTL